MYCLVWVNYRVIDSVTPLSQRIRKVMHECGQPTDACRFSVAVIDTKRLYAGGAMQDEMKV